MMRLAALYLAVCATASLGISQVGTSEVLGIVRDASHSVVDKASVTLTNKETGISVKTTTDSNGEYDFLNVQVGHYALTVEQTGFAKSTTDVAVDVEARQRVDINLQVGVVSDTVTVNGVAAVLDTDSSEHSQVVPTAAVAELPLNGQDTYSGGFSKPTAPAIPRAIAWRIAAFGTIRTAYPARQIQFALKATF